jgi:hypothetical protein
MVLQRVNAQQFVAMVTPKLPNFKTVISRLQIVFIHIYIYIYIYIYVCVCGRELRFY